MATVWCVSVCLRLNTLYSHGLVSVCLSEVEHVVQRAAANVDGEGHVDVLLRAAFVLLDTPYCRQTCSRAAMSE